MLSLEPFVFHRTPNIIKMVKMDQILMLKKMITLEFQPYFIKNRCFLESLKYNICANRLFYGIILTLDSQKSLKRIKKKKFPSTFS